MVELDALGALDVDVLEREPLGRHLGNADAEGEGDRLRARVRVAMG